RAFSGEEGLSGAAEEVYRAVFHSEESVAVGGSAQIPEMEGENALGMLKAHRDGTVVQPAEEPVQVVATTTEPAAEHPQPEAPEQTVEPVKQETPAVTTEPVAEQTAEQPQPEVPAEPVQEELAAQPEPAPAEGGPKPDSEYMKNLLGEVQAQLAELQAKYEAEQRAKDEAEQQQKAQTTENQE
ncbi:MAG: hypothetical protein IKY91_07065, partial [Akkermansia sp.]|nr:hypothetical protein [Akkermansia sp.]